MADWLVLLLMIAVFTALAVGFKLPMGPAIALAAPPFYNVLLGLAAALFAILLTLFSRSLFLKKK